MTNLVKNNVDWFNTNAEHSFLTFSTWHNLVIDLKWQKKQTPKKKYNSNFSLKHLQNLQK